MELDIDVRYEGDSDFSQFRRLSTLATNSSVEQMAEFVLDRARENAPSFSGDLKRNSHRTRGVWVANIGTSRSSVVFEEDYAKFVEKGFRGHFVPFHIAPSLYIQAIQQWGWRIPAPGQVSNARSGFVYLIPPGRKSPTWGVFVRGDAQPFLGPAVQQLVHSGVYLRILQHEFTRHYRLIHGG